MARTTNSERLKKAEEKLAKAAAHRDRLKAQISQQERKRDTRRKVLIGAAILAAIDEGTVKEKVIRSMLARYLTRESDRALFDLDQPAGTQNAPTDEKTTPPMTSEEEGASI